MRKSKQSAAEIEQLELAESQRRGKRNKVFKSLVPERDRGWVRLSNGSVFQWPVTAPLEELVPRQHVPEGHFMLDGKLYDYDEFLRYARWV